MSKCYVAGCIGKQKLDISDGVSRLGLDRETRLETQFFESRS